MGINRAIDSTRQPGSTFKIITSAANIEEYLKGNKKAFSDTHIFNSNRYRYIGGTPYDGILSCGFMRKLTDNKSQIDGNNVDGKASSTR